MTTLDLDENHGNLPNTRFQAWLLSRSMKKPLHTHYYHTDNLIEIGRHNWSTNYLLNLA